MSLSAPERRTEARRRTLLTGRIEFLNRSSLDCVIRNVSTDGAKITLDQEISAPDVFDLVFLKHQKRRRVVAVWRDQHAIGVLFVLEQKYRNSQPFTACDASA